MRFWQSNRQSDYGYLYPKYEQQNGSTEAMHRIKSTAKKRCALQ